MPAASATTSGENAMGPTDNRQVWKPMLQDNELRRRLVRLVTNRVVAVQRLPPRVFDLLRLDESHPVTGPRIRTLACVLLCQICQALTRDPGPLRLGSVGLALGALPAMTPAQTVVWDIPEPHATFDVSLDDGSVTVVRRHGNPTGPRLVISHGTGLAVDLYVPFWSAFLDDFDLIVHDLRNHGWNDRGALANHTIP